MSAKLVKLRTDIAATKREISQIKHAALDGAGIASQVDTWLKQQDSLVAKHFTGLAMYLAFETSGRSGDVWPLFSEGLAHRPELALALQVHFQRESVRKHLIDAAEEGVKELPRVADRRAEETKLKDLLLTLEVAEEAEIERLEAVGETVYRRPDMDARAIVGMLD